MVLPCYCAERCALLRSRRSRLTHRGLIRVWSKSAGHLYAFDLVAVSRPRVLPDCEFVIEGCDFVQPVDNFFVSRRGCVATGPFRFLAEKRSIGRDRGVRQRLIHIYIYLTPGLPG